MRPLAFYRGIETKSVACLPIQASARQGPMVEPFDIFRIEDDRKVTWVGAALPCKLRKIALNL
jgi:hypothetical protein